MAETLRALVIDRERRNREVLSAILSTRGFAVDQVQSVAAALTMMSTAREYRVVVCGAPRSATEAGEAAQQLRQGAPLADIWMTGCEPDAAATPLLEASDVHFMTRGHERHHLLDAAPGFSEQERIQRELNTALTGLLQDVFEQAGTPVARQEEILVQVVRMAQSSIDRRGFLRRLRGQAEDRVIATIVAALCVAGVAWLAWQGSHAVQDLQKFLKNGSLASPPGIEAPGGVKH